jgi:hypothetical protein
MTYKIKTKKKRLGKPEKLMMLLATREYVANQLYDKHFRDLSLRQQKKLDKGIHIALEKEGY